MSRRRTIDVPLNRVEGDLQVQAELDGDVVAQARCSGVLFRGFEQLLVGRAPRDGLVLTPRICGICSVAQLSAAVAALEGINGTIVPDNAVRLRNVTLLTENLQSDLRHGVLMFAADFTAAAHAAHPSYDEAQRRYRQLAGSSVRSVLRETREFLRIVAVIGGHWPHVAFMVPGGIASRPTADDLSRCRYHAQRYRRWYEERVLGCSVERWQAVQSGAELDAWLAESDAHRQSEVGFMLRFLRQAKLSALGRGVDRFVCYGGFPLPRVGSVASMGGEGNKLLPAGFFADGQWQPFEQAEIREHVAHAWFASEEASSVDETATALHPSVGSTRPTAGEKDGQRYSWAKAPRYAGQAAETGPLAERLMAGDPLFTSLVASTGATVETRQLARLTRGAWLLPVLEQWLAEVKPSEPYYRPVPALREGEGHGLSSAARGGLGHWIALRDGAISHYQIISPTTWNASPRDDADAPGPLEAALAGTVVRDVADPIELGHIVRSFDPCLVCTVHTLRRGERPSQEIARRRAR